MGIVKWTEKQIPLIIGLGMTGFSCAHYLTRKNIPFRVADTREQPPELEKFKISYPNALIHLGSYPDTWLDFTSVIIVSPGLAREDIFYKNATDKNIPIFGDIEIFAHEAKQPICGITGSNGKSTVTSLVYEMAKAAGLTAGCGGNIGTPALDLLEIADPDLFILELSSFQLEITDRLNLQAAVYLNLNHNHLDRYPNMKAYGEAKQRIYQNAQFMIWNRDDKATDPDIQSEAENRISFGLSRPDEGEFGLIESPEGTFLAFGQKKLLRVNEMHLKGRHNWLNALAALAAGFAMGLPISAMISALQTFPGLEHRCQFLGNFEGVDWFNDSKSTNVSATLAAIEGLGPNIREKLIIIMGGQDKNDDFTRLIPALKSYVRSVILFGRDAAAIGEVLNSHINIEYAQDLANAIELANHHACEGDAVLLSPACASYDMFKNFEHRGKVFQQLIKERFS